MRKYLLTFFVFFLLGVNLLVGQENQIVGSYELMVGEIGRIDVTGAQRVSILNPDFLDVVKVTPGYIDILGKKQGITQVDVWTASGKESYSVNVFEKNLADIKTKLSEILYKKLGLNNIEIIVNKLNGKLILKGEATKDDIDKIVTLTLPFKDYVENLIVAKVERDLVKIDVEILELNKDFEDNLGFDWQNYINVREEPYVAGGEDSGISTTLDRWGKGKLFTKVVSLSRDALTTRINMLVKRNKGKILSQPKLMCLSGEEAKILVGGEVPVVTTTANQTGSSTNVEYKEYGVILKIRPRVTEEDMLKINLYTEVSDIDWANAVTASGIIIPAFSKRNASTDLFLKPGETIFIGGLIQNSVSKNIEKLPALGNIPIVGALFRSKDFQDEKTELVIALTPELIKYENEDKELKKLAQGSRLVSPFENETIGGDLSMYVADIQRKILATVVYPPSAEEDSWQGEMKLSLHLVSNGSLLNAQVLRSSGYPELDDAVLKTVRSLAPYPAFPERIEEKELWIEVPIVFELE